MKINLQFREFHPEQRGAIVLLAGVGRPTYGNAGIPRAAYRISYPYLGGGVGKRRAYCDGVF